MKQRIFLIIIGFLIAIIQADAQTRTTKDYASYPYWQEMMLDPGANFFETQRAFYAYWENREASRGNGFKVFKRWEYHWQSRISPSGEMPAAGSVLRAYNQFIEENPVGSLKSGQFIWEELGPKTRVNYGGYEGVGRVNAIAFHPTDPETIYVGAPAGGLWITHDGGQNWMTTTDELPTIGVSAIAIHADHPETIVIGTGDRDGGNDWGMGCFISTDEGLTFELSNSGMGEQTVGMFAQHETNPNIMLAAANYGIYKTSDFGASWVKTYPLSGNERFRDVKYKPGDMSVVYATSNNGFYRSIDGGDTWTKVEFDSGLSANDRMVLGVTAANDSLVYIVGGGTFKGCYQSRDFGQTFSLMSDSPNILGGAFEGNDDRNQSGYDLILFVDPDTANIVHVGGINLWRSKDEGATWTCTGHWWGDRTNEVHADHHTIAYNPLNKRVYVGNDGGIYWTDNNGNSWHEISEGLGIGQIYKLGVSLTNPDKIIAGFQDNGTATMMGPDWLNTGGGDGMECAIDPFYDSYSYSTLYYGDITRRIDNQSKRTIAGEDIYDIDEKGAWVTPFCISEYDPNIMMIGYKNIWFTNNVKNSGPVKWTKISNLNGNANDVNCAVVEHSPADPNLFIYARHDGMLFKTDNLLDHPTWIDLTSRKPASGVPSDLECHPYEANTIYMTLGRKVFKSIDQGFKWIDITGNLPDININDIVYDKTSIEGLYVATDAGVYYKDAKMESWELFGMQLPVSVEVSELEIYYDKLSRDNCLLRASTFGRGIWQIKLAPGDNTLPPSILEAEAGTGYVDLSWQPPFYSLMVTGYNIYRNDTLIATVTSNSYHDGTVENDVTYQYFIKAKYGSSIESDPSNLVMATPLAPIILPYTQSFERGSAGWNAKLSIEGWKYGMADDLKITGNVGKFFGINSAVAGPGYHVTDYLYTPSIDLSGFVGKTVTLQFNYTMRNYRNYDKFSAVYRISEDEEWVTLEAIVIPGGSGWQWAEKQINIPDSALVDGIQLGFYYDDSNEHAWGAGVDDVQLFVNTTSVFNLALDQSLVVFPNPSKGPFEISLKDSEAGSYNLSLFDQTGRMVLSKTMTSSDGNLQESFDLSQEGAGIYTLILQNGNQQTTKTITIQ